MISVEDHVLPGACVIITRQQCESLSDPIVADDGSETCRRQDINFNLSGEEFRNYPRLPNSTFNNVLSTKFNIGSVFEDIVCKQVEVIHPVPRDPCLYRGYTFGSFYSCA
jgi:hypothetical protein